MRSALMTTCFMEKMLRKTWPEAPANPIKKSIQIPKQHPKKMGAGAKKAPAFVMALYRQVASRQVGSAVLQ